MYDITTPLWACACMVHGSNFINRDKCSQYSGYRTSNPKLQNCSSTSNIQTSNTQHKQDELLPMQTLLIQQHLPATGYSTKFNSHVVDSLIRVSPRQEKASNDA
jgi:hypothetical protein